MRWRLERSGGFGNGFLPNVRAQLQKELGIPPSSVLINASHCHGVVRADTSLLAVQAVKQAWQAMVPVKVGAGAGHEDRISENRRLKMKDGSEVDMRRAYSMPRDEDVASVGPIDPQIGLLRIDRADGRPLAVLYNFACHPIMGVPGGGNTADYPGFASKVIEESLGGGAIALFIQGCAGDINPVRYKEVSRPADAEPLGNMLGLSVMSAWKKIATKAGGELKVSNEVLALPRGTDLERRIAAIQAEQAKLLQSLKPTTINFKTFLPLLVQQKMSPDFPSHYGAKLPARQGGRKKRPCEARRRQSCERRCVPAEHPDHGATYAVECESRLAQETPRAKPCRRETDARCRSDRRAHRRLQDGDLPRRADRTDRPEHQESRERPARLRRRLQQRLHLLHADRRTAQQRRLRAGGLRFARGARVAEDLRDEIAGGFEGTVRLRLAITRIGQGGPGEPEPWAFQRANL